jgi:RimJ/RimL family protein N-acetyltransferase
MISKVMKQSLFTRLANEQDIQKLFEWRNHPSIRKNSADVNEISWDEHIKWFRNRHNLIKEIIILLGEIDAQSVGVVTFEIDTFQREARVSIYLVPDSSFKGWGECLLTKAELWFRHHHPLIKTFRAHVLPNNDPSKKLFSKLNYTSRISQGFYEFIKK